VLIPFTRWLEDYVPRYYKIALITNKYCSVLDCAVVYGSIKFWFYVPNCPEGLQCFRTSIKYWQRNRAVKSKVRRFVLNTYDIIIRTCVAIILQNVRRHYILICATSEIYIFIIFDKTSSSTHFILKNVNVYVSIIIIFSSRYGFYTK